MKTTVEAQGPVDVLVGRLRAHAEAHEYIANADEGQRQWMHDLYDAADALERAPRWRDVAMLRAALVGLIGADGEQELRQMEATMRVLPAPDADKAVSINAIHALLATLTPNA